MRRNEGTKLSGRIHTQRREKEAARKNRDEFTFQVRHTALLRAFKKKNPRLPFNSRITAGGIKPHTHTNLIQRLLLHVVAEKKRKSDDRGHS